MEWFSWIKDYWSIIVVAIPIVIGVVTINHLLGNKISVPFGILGAMFLVYLTGRKIERDNQRKYVQDIEDKREREYEKIDSRVTTQPDVLERLRKRSF